MLARPDPHGRRVEGPHPGPVGGGPLGEEKTVAAEQVFEGRLLLRENVQVGGAGRRVHAGDPGRQLQDGDAGAGEGLVQPPAVEASGDKDGRGARRRFLQGLEEVPGHGAVPGHGRAVKIIETGKGPLLGG